MIDGTAIQKVAELAREGQSLDTITAEIEGHVFSSVVLHHLPPKPEPEPAALKFGTLKALAEYVAANRDGLKLDTCVVHVEDPQHVHLLGPIRGEKRQRFCYATASCTDLANGFVNTLHDQENFVVGMQSRVVDMGQRPEVLAVISKLKQEQAIEQDDDGVSQRVTAKGGVTLAIQVPLPNPVTLAPYRTFREVEQPAGRFVLRVVNGPKIGLFEADGGAWKIEAVQRVAAWLQEHTKDLPILS